MGMNQTDRGREGITLVIYPVRSGMNRLSTKGYLQKSELTPFYTGGEPHV